MPVFDTAAAFRASRVPGYLEKKHQRALTAGVAAQTDLLNKRTEYYDTEVGIEQQKANTAASRTELDWNKYYDQLGAQQTEWIRNAAAAARAADDAGADPNEAFWVNLDNSAPGTMEQAKRLLPDFQYDRDTADALIETADDFLGRNPRRTLSLEESMAIPGMTEDRARNSVVQADKDGQIYIDDKPLGRTEWDVNNDPRTSSQLGKEHQFNLDGYNESSSVQEMIGSTLPRIADLPDAVGFSGKLALGGAGVLGTMGFDEYASAFSQWVAGAEPEEVAAITAQLQAVRGQLIPIITGQESRARLSDQEQQLGDKAVSLINEIRGPADLAKNYPQVLGALTQFYEESWARKYRIAERDNFIDWPYNLNSRDELIEFIDEVSNAGLADDSIRRLVTRLRLIQGITVE